MNDGLVMGVEIWGEGNTEDELFGEEDPELDRANEARLKAVAEAHRAKLEAASKLAVIIPMSQVILDVKPWDDTTDLCAMEQCVRGIAHPEDPNAIEWLSSQLEDVGYGIKKIRIMVQVYDEKVSVEDDIVEVIEGFEDYVQSCDVFALHSG